MDLTTKHYMGFSVCLRQNEHTFIHRNEVIFVLYKLLFINIENCTFIYRVFAFMDRCMDPNYLNMVKFSII